MRVIPSQDERDLAAMCRKLLAAELEPEAQWKALTDAGVLGLVVDGSLSDIGIFCVEAGRALCPRVVQSTVYAALAIHWLGVGSDWLHRLTSGEARGTYALFDPSDASVSPSSGVVDFVPDADVADVLIASTSDRGGGRRHVVRRRHRARIGDGRASGVHGALRSILRSTR